MEVGMLIMMISPECFISRYINNSYAELLSVRDELIDEICGFEKHKDEVKEIIIHPSPEVVYQCNLLYMAKLCELISEKYNKSIPGTDL